MKRQCGFQILQSRGRSCLDRGSLRLLRNRHGIFMFFIEFMLEWPYLNCRRCYGLMLYNCWSSQQRDWTVVVMPAFFLRCFIKSFQSVYFHMPLMFFQFQRSRGLAMETMRLQMLVQAAWRTNRLAPYQMPRPQILAQGYLSFKQLEIWWSYYVSINCCKSQQNVLKPFLFAARAAFQTNGSMPLQPDTMSNILVC